MENVGYTNVVFTDEELVIINSQFERELYYPYVRIGDDGCSVRYHISYTPFFMEDNGWKFVCSGITIYVAKIEIGGIIEYRCTAYLSGLKVDYYGGGENSFIKNDYFSNSVLNELMGELFTILFYYRMFQNEHKVDHISF